MVCSHHGRTVAILLRMRFTAVLQSNGKTATGVEVPADVVAALGSSRRPKVRVTIGGYAYRSSIASMGGVFMLGVSSEVRTATGVAAGDELDVDVVLDEEPREVAVPADLADALARTPVAEARFHGLNYSNQRRLVMAVDGAKTAETRQRRIDKTVAGLVDGTV